MTVVTDPVVPARAFEPIGSGPAMRMALAAVVERLRPRRGPSRLLGWTAAFWMLSASFHLVVWFVDGGAWAGAVSWRKPIVFSLSMALMAWAVAWLLDHLPARPRLSWTLATTVAASASAETLLIALQTWRRQPSHFTTAGGIDAAVFIAMGVIVAVLAIAIVATCLWALIERPTDPIARSALLWGFGLVIIGFGLGQWLLDLGFSYVDRFGEVPPTVTYGEAGVAKCPHAIAFHGIQVFALASALLHVGRSDRRRARRLMGITVASYAGLGAFSVAQTGAGRAPLDLVPATAALLVVAGLALAASLAVMAVGAVRAVSVGPSARD